MSGIKYYQLTKGEELPDEFCAVRDIDGEPSEYTFYVPEAENAKLRNEVDNLLDFEHLTSVAVAYAGCDECGEYKQTMLRLFAENAKLRELCADMYEWMERSLYDGSTRKNEYELIVSRMCELGVEVN